jgi:arylsulfatase A-like enzyme
MPRPPSYNEADVSDKPAWVQRRPLMDDDCSTENGIYNCHKQVVEDWRECQETLMSVDVMVRDLVSALAETNQLERTYIVFASDNGYLLGQHRLYSKGGPYEETQGVPFVVRGPGVRRGVTSEELVANIDLAPTIAEWAGIEAPAYVDGRSLAVLLEGSAASWRRYLLFEHFKHRYAGVRTAQGESYVEHETGEEEYYDLTGDPWQLDSAHSAPENVQRIGELSALLSELMSCAGASCRSADGGP